MANGNSKWLERITSGVLCAGFAAGVSWGLLQSNVSQAARELERQGEEIKILDNRTQQMEMMQARIDERLKSIDERLRNLTDWIQQREMDRAP